MLFTRFSPIHIISSMPPNIKFHVILASSKSNEVQVDVYTISRLNDAKNMAEIERRVKKKTHK